VTHSDVNSTCGQQEEPIEGLFPEGKARPLDFGDKPVIFISSRVHPGEVPAQWVFDGFLNFVLDEDDPRAEALRQHFVVKMVPLLNPDGVFLGCYRSDSIGQNLNRYYTDPDLTLQPTIWAAKAVMMQLHERGVHSNYVDLHAHATRRGCFLYGNAIPDVEQQIQNVMYGRLVALNSPHLDFDGCNFTERNMKAKDKRDGLSKEGSGRVAIFKETGLVHSYVLECNYNTGRTVNTTPNSTTDDPRCSPGRAADKKGPPKYTPEIYMHVGKALALAMLDQKGLNPWSRLPNSHAQNLENLKAWVTSHVAGASKTYRQDIKEKGLDTMSTRKKVVNAREPESKPAPAKRAAQARRMAAVASRAQLQSKMKEVSKDRKNTGSAFGKDPCDGGSDEESAPDSDAAGSDDEMPQKPTESKSCSSRKEMSLTKQQLAEALRAGLTMAALDGDTQEQGSSIDVTQQGNSRGGSSEGTTDTTHGGTDGTTKLQQVQTTGKTLDRARSIAERRQRHELQNARRRVTYVADRSNDAGLLNVVVGRCVSVQPAQPSREELVTRVVAPQMLSFGGRNGGGLSIGHSKMDARQPPRNLKSSNAPRRRRLGNALQGQKLLNTENPKEVAAAMSLINDVAHPPKKKGGDRPWAGGE